MFENLQVESGDVPRAADVEWELLDPRFRTRQLVATLVVLAIIAAFLAALHTILFFAFRSEGIDMPLAWIWVLLIVIAAPMLRWPFISVPRMGYAVRQHDVLFRTGVVWRRVSVIPCNRIQHVETDTSPLDRRFGLANLKLFTAGGAGGDLRIPGLPAATAESLRQLMLERIGGSVEQD